MDTESGVVNKLTDILTTMQNSVRALNNIQQTLLQVFPLATGTSATATGGAETLPANPVGFVEVYVPSLAATVKFPYYL